MQIVTLQDARLLAWANAMLGLNFSPESCRWVAGLADGCVVFVVVYSRFSARNCELTIATDGTRRWATRQSLREIFGLPFLLWGLRRVTFVVRADNVPSLDMLVRLGAKKEGVIEAAFDGDVDGVVFGMLKERCRWIA